MRDESHSPDVATSHGSTEIEYLLMIDRQGYTGAWHTEKRPLGALPEKNVLAHAKQVLETEPGVSRVEVFSREVTTAWEKVEEFRYGA